MKKAAPSAGRTAGKAKAKPRAKTTTQAKPGAKTTIDAKAKAKAKAKTAGATRASKPAAKARSSAKAAAPARAASGAPKRAAAGSATQLIDQRIRELGDWRGETLARMRGLIHEAEPEVIEEWKWRGTPVWSRHGIVCTGESYKDYVKLTFARGARLPDPSRLFNASLEGNARRAIDIHEGEQIDAGAFKALVKAAVAANGPAR